MLRQSFLLLFLALSHTFVSGESTMTHNYTVTWSENQHTYFAIRFNSSISWSWAKEYCKLLGSHLVTITSKKENSFVFNVSRYLPLQGWDGPWLGGFQNTTSPKYSEPKGGWEWVTGELWNYTAWRGGEPNNFGSSEHFLNCWKDDLSWNDVKEDPVNEADGKYYSLICDRELIYPTNFSTSSNQPIKEVVVGIPLVVDGNGNSLSSKISEVDSQGIALSNPVGVTFHFTNTLIETLPTCISEKSNISILIHYATLTSEWKLFTWTSDDHINNRKPFSFWNVEPRTSFGNVIFPICRPPNYSQNSTLVATIQISSPSLKRLIPPSEIQIDAFVLVKTSDRTDTEAAKPFPLTLVIGASAGGAGLILILIVFVAVLILWGRKKRRQIKSTKHSYLSENDLLITDEVKRESFYQLFRATWKNDPVYVEVFHNEFTEEEITQLMTLRHPHLLLCFGIHSNSNKEMGIVVETAHHYESKRIPLPFIVEIMIQVTSALAYLHNHCKIVHRGVLLSRLFNCNGQTKLGPPICSSVEIKPNNNDWWNAPEVFQNPTKAVFTPASDIWSLGILFLHLFNLSILPVSLQKPILCPDALWDIMRRCFELNPMARSSAQGIHEQLKTYHELSVPVEKSPENSQIPSENFYVTP
jgi:hypothetical protein